MSSSLPADVVKQIDDAVSFYKNEHSRVERFAKQLRLLPQDKELAKYVHSVKWRVKEVDHLRDKLVRKYHKTVAGDKTFAITPENLFSEVTDLAGVRILHLYTRQVEHINRRLLELFRDEMYVVVDGPFAHTWDDEYRKYFKSIGIRSEENPRLYTSVHYVLRPNEQNRVTGEIQVRTLAEELWGEVDHAINYPHESKILACKEQIRVLARVTSSCTRLVDSIFLTHEEGRSTGTTVDDSPTAG